MSDDTDGGVNSWVSVGGSSRLGKAIAAGRGDPDPGELVAASVGVPAAEGCAESALTDVAKMANYLNNISFEIVVREDLRKVKLTGHL